MASAYRSEHKTGTLSSSRTTGFFLLRGEQNIDPDVYTRKENQILLSPSQGGAPTSPDRWSGQPPRMKMPREKANELAAEHHCQLKEKEIPFKETI